MLGRQPYGPSGAVVGQAGLLPGAFARPHGGGASVRSCLIPSGWSRASCSASWKGSWNGPVGYLPGPAVGYFLGMKESQGNDAPGQEESPILAVMVKELREHVVRHGLPVRVPKVRSPIFD